MIWDALVVGAGIAGLGVGAILAKERGLKGFTADVLASNKSMMKVFEKGGLPVRATISEGVYELTIPFE